MKRAGGSLGVLLAVAVAGCTPGYIKGSDLASREQGPEHCAAACHDIGLRMGALVLVGASIPGCVCVPAGEAPAGPAAGESGAGAAIGGHAVLVAAAAAARRQQQQQQQQQQQAR